MRVIIAALLVGLTSATCGEPSAVMLPPPGCPTQARCEDLCWAAEDVNPWDCLDACMSDDDSCLDPGIKET